jgi:very-short-patch-repair endonuclease
MLTEETIQKRKKRLLGKTWIELYGEEKAEEFKQKHSKRLIETKIHLGHTHSDFNKKLFSINCTKMHENNMFNKVSKEEDFFYQILLDNFGEYKWLRNKSYGFFTLDFSIPEFKFGIEIDGDYWHCNEKLNFFPLTTQQKRNIKNDLKKNKFFCENDWTLIRLWVSDIKKDTQTIIEMIKGTLCQLQK